LQWADFSYSDAQTYELELRAVDSVAASDVIICATNASVRSGIWGELLTTAASVRGALGVITNGGVRDIAQMKAMGFPVFAKSVCPYDSLNRQKVIAYDVTIELDGVLVAPGDIVIADIDGVAIVPQAVGAEVLAAAIVKANKEDAFREAVVAGASLVKAYKRYKIL
jgi:4-hydroxy-4-methyl-2-oxoglutarate aldolase